MKEKTQKKKKMTLDDLAEMVQRGFVDTETRLGAKIDNVEQKLGSRIDGVEKELGGIIGRLNGVENRLDNVVVDISGMKKEILKKLDKKVDKVEFTGFEERVSVLENVAVKQKKVDR